MKQKGGKISTAEYFLRRKLVRAAKHSKLKEMPLHDLSWLKSLPINEEWWRRWEAISALVNQELAKEKKWHSDHDKNMAPLENGIPSLNKRSTYRVEFTDDEGGAETPEDGAYEREKIDDVFRTGEIVEEFFEGDTDDEEPTPVQDSPEDTGGSLHPFLPRRAVPKTHILMRRYPRHLKESLARGLNDSRRLLFEEPKNLLPALCFFEVGIEDEATFRDIRDETYVGGPFHVNGKKFGFKEYKQDLLRLFHVLKKEKRLYFLGNRFLRRAAAEVSKEPEKLLLTLWERFEGAYEALTPKQWNALKQVRVKKRSQASVAQGMRISIDSLRDRIEGAELKFRRALPELASFSPSETYKKNATCNYIHSGLFDKRAAKHVAPLFRVDPVTKEKTEIAPYKGEKRERQGANKALIKAWAHDSSPVPDFSFTDYFTKLFPRGMIDRMQAGEPIHDRSSGVHTHETKTRDRDHYHPNHAGKNKE